MILVNFLNDGLRYLVHKTSKFHLLDRAELPPNKSIVIHFDPKTGNNQTYEVDEIRSYLVNVRLKSREAFMIKLYLKGKVLDTLEFVNYEETKEAINDVLKLGFRKVK